MEIAVVGAGHAGLVAAAGLASSEHRVRVLDSDTERIEEHRRSSIRVAVNPEFLAEGSGVRDFLRPDRIVLGSWDLEPIERLRAVYEPLIRSGQAEGRPVPVLVTDPPTAELTKYSANAFLAVKISFINEIATIADELGADITEIARGIGLDRRLGPDFLQAGVGWGGACFPKDSVA